MYQGNLTLNIEEIEVHIRTYRSLLKSAGEVRILNLIDSHLTMNSILQEKGAGTEVDIAAFIYCLLRLPSPMSNVKKIILGQSYSVFEKNGFGTIEKWQEVAAPGRRRKMHFDGKETLGIYIASVTDVDDVITLATAFQIEWNKFHDKLQDTKNVEQKAIELLDSEDVKRIKNIWGDDYHKFLTAIKFRRVDFTIRLLSGSYNEYTKATQHWWNIVESEHKNLNLQERPIYFVSSNTHSITNLLSRFVLAEEKTLIDFLYRLEDKNLIRLWEGISSGDFLASRENFLYYIAKKYARINQEILKRREKLDRKLGIHYIKASKYLDIDTQVIELSKLAGIDLDNRLSISTKHLNKSKALIVNIDYPLGWAAYQVLTEIGQNVDEIRGIYIMGKAATLTGNVGDILLPTTVFDQHTKNVYAINNVFNPQVFNKIFRTGSVLDMQKTVSVKGTFFENKNIIDYWFKEGYNTIEMESGPYLNSAYEFVYYNRYVENQFINLTNSPFELGIAHYASDTPYSKAKNLGVRNLSYEGVEPTYAISLAIIKMIIERETRYL
ncbi:hypothetical protein COV53_01075 [Candidatus Gottesmanbacteria bacterium CG11_big_fil_rev_8_21_14_0_20_37_11]|uniref:Uncharacterized protein n=2 Tax=Candidatus Gottesmaniibacteriota TaxID=1752720 RepID=A0A1J4TRD2_9BACT|nr:MAG: hypothetical protein AUJ73_03270 [Candidatus Gottesmanbacteria bacterium CG1_02_37_22]PIR08827.1 MAG: hypothetical protein COV53_01075 [Candidatus Gottesmanbacteria bacterium CG11_big_fil_rev_8_21_14_0_20_37_11]